MLYGRDEHALRLLARFANHQLGIPIGWTQDIAEACDGFDIIIHQIRYGGLAGREADEQLAITRGSVPDESLGVAGIAAATRMATPIAVICSHILTGSPSAHLINLTNPLGLSNMLMRRAGIRQPIGICELPAATAIAAAGVCGVDPSMLAWDYAGLNHRGFLFNLSIEGQDALKLIAQSGIGDPFGGVTGEALLDFGALPTKYFQLFASGRPVSAPGRAAALNRLRSTILQELDADATQVPPSLAQRHQPWWELSVVPLLHALCCADESTHILNITDDDGLTREGWCTVSRDAVRLLPTPPCPPKPAAWIAAFAAHERAAIDATLFPTLHALETADRADPLSPQFADSGLWRPHPAPFHRSPAD